MVAQYNPEVFISYARKDSKQVDLLINWLEQKGIRTKSLFYDKKNIHGAGNFPKVISDSIENCKVLLFIASKSSINSEWVKDEVYYALKLKKPVLPILIENVNIPGELNIKLSRFQWIMLFDGKTESNYENILNSLVTLGVRTEPNQPIPSPIENGWKFFLGKFRLLISIALLLALLIVGYVFFWSGYLSDNAEVAIEDNVSLTSTISTKYDNEDKVDSAIVLNDMLTVFYSFHVKRGEAAYEIFNNSEVQEGDSIQISIKSLIDSYIYIINVDATSKPYIIYPQNNRSNFLPAKEIISLPGEKDYFLVDDIPGLERLYIIASSRPINQDLQKIINEFTSNPKVSTNNYNLANDIRSRGMSEIVEDSDAKTSIKVNDLKDFDINRYFSGRGVLVKEIRFNHK